MVQNPELLNQSRGRDLTDQEVAFAAALEAIYAAGIHDFAQVVAALNDRCEPRPSGQPGAWTLDVFEAELKDINASHDAAYAANGFGA